LLKKDGAGLLVKDRDSSADLSSCILQPHDFDDQDTEDICAISAKQHGVVTAKKCFVKGGTAFKNFGVVTIFEPLERVQEGISSPAYIGSCAYSPDEGGAWEALQPPSMES
jgi:hypothetical protein